MHDARDLIPPAFDLLGTPYSVMDCQAFVEACLHAIGIRANLSGSNSWYRAMTWTGSPEDCKRTFGGIPQGAYLYMVRSVSDKTPQKYRGDGLGDAYHMGIYTAPRGKGAINSSATKGCVCESNFAGRSINGGWNRVGLDFNTFAYTLNGIIISGGHEQMSDTTTAVVTADSATVKMRKKPSTSCDLYWQVPTGTTVEVSGPSSGEWTPIRYNNIDGYMMTAYLKMDGSQGAAADTVTVAMPRDVAMMLYDIIGGALNVVG